MPLYTYKCDECDQLVDAIRSVANYNECPKCECGGDTQRKIIPPMIAPVLGGGDMPGYQCPVSGQYVTSRRQRRGIMSEYNLIEKG
jgi:putative FmdB family regulatory protein